jgi:hypothetical protein
MKTATINVYHVFGTRNTVSGQVMYRGRVLWCVTANETPNAILKLCTEWAKSNGFTHIKTIYG